MQSGLCAQQSPASGTRFFPTFSEGGKGYRYPYSWQKIGTDDLSQREL
jgi:hypothetical protein